MFKQKRSGTRSASHLNFFFFLHRKNLMNNAIAKHNGCGAAVENISLPLFGNNILHLERKILPGWCYSKEMAILCCLRSIYPCPSNTGKTLEGMVWNCACFLSMPLLQGLQVAAKSAGEGGLLSITSWPWLPRSRVSCFHEWREKFLFSFSEPLTSHQHQPRLVFPDG